MQDTDALLERMHKAIQNTIKEKKIGIAFSGGVDSALIAKICSDLNYDVTLITIGFAGSHDIMFAKKVNEALKMPHHIMEINPLEFSDVVKKIKLQISIENLSWLENSIAFYHIAKLAHDIGLGVVVTANGIDELFCGYNGYRDAIKKGEQEVMGLIDSKITNEIAMMQAVNNVCSEFGVKIVQPLLLPEFIKYAKLIPISEKITGYDDLYRKHIVRRLALHVGVPEFSANARKKAMQYGSLIHKTLIKSKIL
ncbi:MAG: asparagine synthase C-terminal domain-containing protein [Candidatus Nitrosotenuis sp.]